MLLWELTCILVLISVFVVQYPRFCLWPVGWHVSHRGKTDFFWYSARSFGIWSCPWLGTLDRVALFWKPVFKSSIGLSFYAILELAPRWEQKFIFGEAADFHLFSIILVLPHAGNCLENLVKRVLSKSNDKKMPTLSRKRMVFFCKGSCPQHISLCAKLTTQNAGQKWRMYRWKRHPYIFP